MSSTLPTPKVFRNGQNVQLSYDTPYRILASKTYPVRSSNGSVISIHGHENGIRVLWRGGTSFKSPPPEQAKTDSNINGSASNAVMIIDSDDEQPSSTTPQFKDTPEFDDDEQLDTTNSYSPILQYLDLSFNSAVTCLTVPPETISDLPRKTPTIFNENIVFAAACADRSLRLITFPITPPSPMSKARKDIRQNISAADAGHNKWGEAIFQLVGHIERCDAVTMTISSARQVVVASHSNQNSGLLLFHRISAETLLKGLKASPTASLPPFQTHFLSSPAVSIDFNSSILSTSCSTHLLVAERSGACKIYDYSSPSGERPESPAFATQGGSWLLTLYPNFQDGRSDTVNAINFSSLSNFGRKNIVDAKWVFGGRAIIILSADGEWGIWDIEGSCSGASKGLLGAQSIKGGAHTGFNISGWIDGAPTKSTSNSVAISQTSTKFAPMTPGMRRTVEPSLFSGRSGLSKTQGQISVARLPSTATNKPVDECVVFWLEDSFVVIPNLLNYWEAQISKRGGSGGLFGTDSRPVRLTAVNLRGEKCSGVDQSLRTWAVLGSVLPTEIIITCEHRYIIVSDSKPPGSDVRRQLFPRAEKQVPVIGELDVVDIDQALARMENSASFGKQKRGLVF